MTVQLFYAYVLFLFSPVLIVILLNFFKTKEADDIKPWNTSDLAVVLFIDFLLKVSSVFMYSLGILDIKAILTSFSIFMFSLELFAIYLIIKFRYGLSFSILGLKWKYPPFYMIQCLKIIIPIEILIYCIHLILFGSLSLSSGLYVEGQSLQYYILMFFTILVVAPFAEEVIFRGFAFPAIKNKTGTFWAGVITSFFWAIYHPGIYLIIVSFILGMVYFYLFQKHKTLLSPIFAHFLHNLIFVILTF